jgi:hypothetical protein
VTQSGQGDGQQLPAVRPAHEGVVLPADGSEPWIPGVTDEQVAPAGGQPWGQPWGPQQSRPGGPAGQPGPYAQQGQPVQGGQPGQPGQPGPFGQHGQAGQQGQAAQPGPYGQPGQPGQQGPYGQPGQSGQFGQQDQAGQEGQAGQFGQQDQAGQQGQAGQSGPYAQQGQAGQPGPSGQPGQSGLFGQQGQAGQSGPYGQPGQQAQAGQSGSYGQQGQAGRPGPSAQPGQSGRPGPFGQQGQPGQPEQPGQHGQPGQAGQLGQQGPPGQAGPYGQQDQNGRLGQPGPYGQSGQGQFGAQPLPQAMPPQAPGMGDSDATQFIPPVAPLAPGALPPEAPAESTQFLGSRAMPGAGASDADATQYIAPVPPAPVPPAPAGAPFGIRPGAPGDRQPPAEFDSLFRTDAPAAQPADATAQLPRFEAPGGAQSPYQQQQQYQQPQPHYEPQGPEPGPRRRKSAAVPLIAAVVVGCAVLGLGVSAMIFSGDDEKKNADAGKSVAATSPAPSNSPKAAADPAEPQAEALDKLLADSNNSRSAVIRSVENIKQCKNLDQASADLTGAAQQRRALVTRLAALTVDKLPDHAKLTASLTKAWQASASADDHYAAWAKQAKSKKVCKGGTARSTSQTVQGYRASNDATKAKQEASGLWNPIAVTYGLTERRSDQL